MPAASLSLLKGGKKSLVADELDKAQPEPEATAAEPEAAAEAEVPVAKMNAKQLDELVKTNGIDPPTGWAKWNAEKRREWLLATFDFEEAGAAEDAPADAAPAQAEPAEPEAAEPEIVSAAPIVEEEPKKAKGKSKPGKTAVATASKTGTVELPGDNVIADIVHEIENLKEKEALSLIPQLAEQAEVTFFKLGGILSLIQANSWYAPHASMREFIENGQGLEYRKAMYWISIYNKVSEAQVPFSKLAGVPWTKLKEIVSVITPENVDQWVAIALEQNTITLIQTVKNHLNADKQASIEDGKAKTIIAKTFKVHSEQAHTIDAAIDKAKEQTGTSSDAVALELICGDFLGGQTLAQKLHALGIEAACEALEKAFPNASFSVEVPEDADQAA